jgi:hypothetical protein
MQVWRERFRMARLEGLADKPRPGAPRQVSDAEVEALITRTLETVPAQGTHSSTRTIAQWCGCVPRPGSADAGLLAFQRKLFRVQEIFQSDVIRSFRERANRRSPAHRLDEFPVGYSSASCTPALLASAWPTGIHSATQARRRQTSFQPTANSVLTFCVTSGDNRISTSSPSAS